MKWTPRHDSSSPHRPTPPQRTACPLCEDSEFTYRFTKQEREFWRCRSCGIELQSPLPTRDELAAYYESSYSGGMYQDFAAAREMKRMTARRRITEIRRHLPLAGRWLDVGAGDGTFVEVVGESGPTASGVELSETAVSLAEKRGLDVTCGTVDSLADDRRFDTITAFDVLEHVLDPGVFLDQLFARLRPGGSLVLTLPDLDSVARRVMAKRWFFYIPEEHLHYFNRRNLTDLLVKRGFQVDRAGRTYKPLTFDYAMTQFAQYNPWIHRVLGAAGRVAPAAARRRIVPLPIGEMMVIARRPDVNTPGPNARNSGAKNSDARNKGTDRTVVNVHSGPLG